jgi:hypothetical protein
MPLPPPQNLHGDFLVLSFDLDVEAQAAALVRIAVTAFSEVDDELHF